MPSQPERGSAGESCSPGGRACSGRLSPLLPALGRAGGAALAPHPRPGRAGISEPVGRARQLLGNKAMFTSDSSGLAAGSRAVAPRDPGGDIQRSPGMGSGQRFLSCSAGFRNARAARKQQPQRSRGCLLLPKPLPALGVTLPGGTWPLSPPYPGGPGRATATPLWVLIPRAPAGQRGRGEPQTPGQLLHPGPPCPPPCPEAAGRSHVMYISREALGVNQCILGEGKFFYLVE